MDKRIWGILGGIALVLALLSPLVLGGTKKVKRVFEDAEELFEQAQYEDAILKYNKALKEAEKVGAKVETIDPDFMAHVNYKIARCLKLLNRADEALQHYRLIAVEFPNTQYATDSYVDSGDIYFDRKDYEAAGEAYKQALDTIVDVEIKKQIHQKYQQTLVLINPPKPTLIPEPTALEMEEIDTPNFAALTDATFLRFEKRFKEAATQYEVFADSYLPVEEALYALYWAGRCYYDAGLFSQSVDAFQKLIDDYAYSPNAIEAYHGLAEAYYTLAERDGDDKSKYQLVISTVEQAEKKYEGSGDTKVGDWIKRMQAIKKEAVDKVRDLPVPPPEPDESADDLVRQGLEHYNRDEFETARRKAEEALKLVPNHSGANKLLSKIAGDLVWQGLEHYNRDEFETARRKAEEALKLVPNHSGANKLLSKIAGDLVRQGLEYYNRDEFETARRKAEEALKLVPNHSGANKLLLEIEAEKHYLQGLRFLDANRYNAAIVEFNKVINLEKQRKEAHFYLGVAYFNLHNYTYAKNAVKDALAIDSEYEEALRLLEAIIEAAD